MANVTTYLNKILSAVYGKDVRRQIQKPTAILLRQKVHLVQPEQETVRTSRLISPAICGSVLHNFSNWYLFGGAFFIPKNQRRNSL